LTDKKTSAYFNNEILLSLFQAICLRSGAKKRHSIWAHKVFCVVLGCGYSFFQEVGFILGFYGHRKKKTKLNGEADGRCPNDVRKTNSDVINRTLYRK
jgi:hypothetical protein